LTATFAKNAKKRAVFYLFCTGEPSAHHQPPRTTTLPSNDEKLITTDCEQYRAHVYIAQAPQPQVWPWAGSF